MINQLVGSIIRNKRIRRSRIICFAIFKFYPYPKNRKTLWDSTSLLLKSALKKWIKPSDHVLDIGTGDIALLSNYLVRTRRSVSVKAIDICEEFIINAKNNHNKDYDGITYMQSNLYDEINDNEKFDVIFSNPPYVKKSRINPSRHMKYHGFSDKKMVYFASDGGEQGIETIKNIIRRSIHYLKDDGSLVLGYNQYHVDNDLIKEIIANNGFYIFDQIYSKYTSCTVINLKKTEK